MEMKEKKKLLGKCFLISAFTGYKRYCRLEAFKVFNENNVLKKKAANRHFSSDGK